MSLKISTGLANALLNTGGLKEAMAGMHLYIYSGTEPTTADASLGSAVLLCDVSGDGTGAALLLGTPVDGTIEKDATQAWQGTCAATGTASFFRLALPADTGDLSTTAVRVQGNVGTAGKDLNISSVSLTSGAIQRVSFASITQPRQ